MEKFSVNQLAKMAGVSVRTLHHYDHIGLLKPSLRSEANYRFYGRAELLRLQQILLYKEMGLPLHRIGEILDEPGFDMITALQEHRQELETRKHKMDELLQTIDNTIQQLKKQEKMNYEELYKGFSKEQAEAYEKEAKEKWGEDRVEETKQRLLNLSKDDWDALQKEGEAVHQGLAASMHLDPSAPEVQALVKRHCAMIGVHYTVIPEIYRGLAQLYVTDSRFTAFYEKIRPGLAGFLSKAMEHYCDLWEKDRS